MTNQDVCDFISPRMQKSVNSNSGINLVSEMTVASPPKLVSPTKKSSQSAVMTSEPVTANSSSASTHTIAATASTNGSFANMSAANTAAAATLGQLCKDLLDHCLHKGTMDNCTVILVDLRNGVLKSSSIANAEQATDTTERMSSNLDASDRVVTADNVGVSVDAPPGE